MEPEDYCDIFCSHLLSPRLYDYLGEVDELILLDNGDGLEFGRVERHHCPITRASTIIYHFNYMPFATHNNIFVTVGFRLAITVHCEGDLEIEDNCQ